MTLGLACSGGRIVAGAPDNPFSRSRCGSGALDYDFGRGASLAQLLARLAALGGCGQIVGPPGSGKSTLLRTVARAERARGREVVEVRADRDDVVEALDRLRRDGNEQRLLCVDEADAVPRRLWRRLLAAPAAAGGAGVAVLAAGQREISLPVVVRCAGSERLAVQLAEVVLQRSPRAAPLVAAVEAAEAWRQSGGDMREALSRMYDWYEQRWAERAGR